MKINRHRVATEKLPVDHIIEAFSNKKHWAGTVLQRIEKIVSIPSEAKILDVGAASGSLIAACTALGYRCEGIEPCEEARLNSTYLSAHLDVPIKIIEGSAESLPYPKNNFDVVLATSVIEHVLHVDRAFKEINRVLRLGGVFWFNTAISMCPRQGDFSSKTGLRKFMIDGIFVEKMREQ